LIQKHEPISRLMPASGIFAGSVRQKTGRLRSGSVTW